MSGAIGMHGNAESNAVLLLFKLPDIQETLPSALSYEKSNCVPSNNLLKIINNKPKMKSDLGLCVSGAVYETGISIEIIQCNGWK